MSGGWKNVPETKKPLPPGTVERCMKALEKRNEEMSMDQSEREHFIRRVKEEAFRVMTRHEAPGRDIPMARAGSGLDHDARLALWDLWSGMYADAVAKTAMVAYRILEEQA